MPTKDILFITSAQEITPLAKSQIKPAYLSWVGKSNAEFFAPLKKDFPKTFEQLTQCAPVSLMELAFERVTGMGETVTDFLYSWFVTLPSSQQNHAYFKIPRYAPDSEARKKMFENYYTKIPAQFHNFFTNFDGGKIANDIAFTGKDFPHAYDDWVLLSEYFSDREDLSEGDALALEDQLGTRKAKVVCTLRNRDFVVCVLDSEQTSLYLVKKNQPTFAEILEQPHTLFDAYLERCLIAPDNQNIALI